MPDRHAVDSHAAWRAPLLDRLLCRLGLHLFMPDGTCCVCRVKEYRDV